MNITGNNRASLMNAQRNHRAGLAIFGLALSTLVSTPALVPSIVTAVAQEADELPLVGYYVQNPAEIRRPVYHQFIQAMADLGYYEGLNVRYAFASVEGGTDQRAPTAEGLVALGPDVIVVHADGPVVTMKAATATIPIVVASDNGEAMAGHIQNFDRPEGNLTGRATVYQGGPGVPGWSLTLARELLPDATKIGFMLNAGDDHKNATDVADPLGFSLVFGEAESADDAVAAFEAVLAEGVDAVVLRGGPRYGTNHAQIYEAAMAAGIPTFWQGSSYGEPDGAFGEAGFRGLVQVGQDFHASVRTASYIVDRLLRGETPADIPVTMAPLYLAINVGAAESLGLRIPDAVMARATEIIDN